MRKDKSMSPDIELTVSDFVALLNQTLEYALSGVVVIGELANFRVSKNKWVYFDLKDEMSTVKFFGNIYQLPGPLEDGMMLKVRGNPRLHNQYGFSVNVQTIQPAGEGTIKRAAQLLQAKLEREGLFDESRKRFLPYPPAKIGLIASKQSAAYADFIKIINARWHGIDIQLLDVLVQGDAAPQQIVSALDQFNAEAKPPDILVLIRGGGSPEDLAAFSTEQVTRAVAASRVPTLVAIGHEIDLSLAELAADKRASTPSNAAELLVPDRKEVLSNLKNARQQISRSIMHRIKDTQKETRQLTDSLAQIVDTLLKKQQAVIDRQRHLLAALSPESILNRGYAVVRYNDMPLRDVNKLSANDIVDVQIARGNFEAKVTAVRKGKKNG
jgi:exodeoxyribonuclease VII large subunit